MSSNVVHCDILQALSGFVSLVYVTNVQSTPPYTWVKITIIEMDISITKDLFTPYVLLLMFPAHLGGKKGKKRNDSSTW